jgi:invasion protein IalB
MHIGGHGRVPSGRAARTTAGALATFAAVAMLGCAGAFAQDVAAWRVECTGDGKTLDCRAVQQVFQRETRQLLVSLVVRPAADAKTGAMILQLPLGLNLTEPILVKVDNGAAEKQPIQTCTNVGCFVAMTVADKLLAAMRTGSVLHITVQDANKKSIDITLPLLGFGLAFDKAK